MNPPPLPIKERFPWLPYWIVMALIALFALAPVGCVMVAGVIANTYGCKLDEGSVHPCVVNGEDYGHLLYTLGVSGWFMLATIPLGFLAVLVWVIVLVFHRERWKKRNAAAV